MSHTMVPDENFPQKLRNYLYIWTVSYKNLHVSILKIYCLLLIPKMMENHNVSSNMPEANNTELLHLTILGIPVYVKLCKYEISCAITITKNCNSLVS